MMRTVVLAAGRGSRLGELTDERPKSLVPLAGTPLLTRLLTSLRTAGVRDVTIVTGYRADLIAEAAPGCRTLHSARWARTNMAASLLVADDAGLLADGAVVSYADIVVEPRVLTALLDAPAAPVTLPVNTAWLDVWSQRMADPLADAERLILGDDGRLLDIGGTPAGLEEVHAQFMGLIRLDPDGARRLTGFYRDVLHDDPAAERWDTTTLLRSWLRQGGTASTVAVDGGWLEVDTPEDKARYEELHRTGRLDAICSLDIPQKEGNR
ncbi:phosphocholine cytidylyltransferase family protein [Streptomyces sp. ISL-22]|uniref:phosphocholine cytidylyltransferase family protein n=1 Tax=unclassified Streptomyces TaxID=2593676 RepID=UPI001BE7D2DE|nr:MULTISPECIES: phosphocholine cytidylyltransferase family protein [unclassified Streptomyces]MBT2417997.1 phosphocholine cytidylyltransferase family protein [Streptomyces sp. ISL-24]MBT2432328.1 phosphocholine cytidylyltransferase family protein [Streptomyces sp. ISL-22]